MEGRARARPDVNHSPSGCPKTLAQRLQWRAGHVPGLTRGLMTVPTASESPLAAPMEGRARARPDPS